MTEPRTFKIMKPTMRGDDITNWQREIKAEFFNMDIICPIVVDGVYGIATRSYNASLCHALGMNASEVMADGITPELRIRIRNRRLTQTEHKNMDDRVEWRRRLRERYFSTAIHQVHRPVDKIIEDSWGYHPGVHDGLDVITQTDPVIYAMIKSKIIDVRAFGWWSLGAPSDPILRGKGDGIIQMEILETIGPFRKGYHIGYGHAEKACVVVGEIVEAGDPVGHAGLANAWHIHLMYNNGSFGVSGRGNIDPRRILDYAVAHG